MLSALEPVADDAIRVAAILWTWLEQYPLKLSELGRKPPKIRAEALELDAFELVGADERARLEDAPIPAAAELLVRVDKRLTQDPPHGMHRVKAVDGHDVLVMWKRANLMRRLRDDQEPPAVLEQPSLTRLAPRLVVCPVECGEVVLGKAPASGIVWNAACDLLEQGCAYGTLSFHLDCLGDAGLEPSEDGIPGWTTDEDRAAGCFDEQALDPTVEQDCTAAAVSAVREVAGRAAVLVLPELLATSRVELQIAETVRELNERGEAPALTVFGLYHRVPDDLGAAHTDRDALLGGEELAKRVNEAVVLGPDGSELWRHRKLSAAQMQAEEDESAEDESAPVDELTPTEDIRPGRRLQLADSPIGWIAVLICMDAFAERLGQRLERCGADVLLVPSLSPTVHRHRNSLQALVQRLWGIALVCNRAPLRPNAGSRWDEAKNRSFWAIARFPPQEPVPAAGSTSVILDLADLDLPETVQPRPPGIQ
jgi:predicted amidohydrolase